MFKDFNISSFKKMKPPGDNTFDTSQEIKALAKIPLKKEFVKKFDNIESAFAKTAKDNNVKDYDKTIFVEEALLRLVEIHYYLGLEEEAQKYAKILGFNYNSSEWYESAYKIFNKKYEFKIAKKEEKKAKMA